MAGFDDPRAAEFLRGLQSKNERLEAAMSALNDRYKRLVAGMEGQKVDMSALKEALTKAQKRVRYIEDIPGKRVPYWQQFAIEIPAPQAPTVTIAGTQLTDVKQISQDGPFVVTTWLSAFLMKTYSLGPYGTEGNGRPNDPVAGSEVITPLTGRWRPVASSADPFAGAYIGVGVGPVAVASAQAVQTFRPGEIDFLFEVQDNSVDRNRQNQIAIPSRYLFSEFDRPCYLPTSDFFERGSTITFKATLTRELGFAEVNWALLAGGFAEGIATPPPDPTAAGNVGRLAVAIGGTLYFTMLGYKILQAQSPAV